jgi:hypothetical protein
MYLGNVRTRWVGRFFATASWGNVTRIRVPVLGDGFRSDKFLKLLNI